MSENVPDDAVPEEGGIPPVKKNQGRLVKRKQILKDGEQQEHFDRQLVKRPWQRGW